MKKKVWLFILIGIVVFLQLGLIARALVVNSVEQRYFDVYRDQAEEYIKASPEMLGIRDTIQSPILMTENRDETMTRFLIPTNTDILYVHEIKVDNYDEIYGENIENVEDVEKDDNEQA